MPPSRLRGLRAPLARAALLSSLAGASGCGGWNVANDLYLPRYSPVWRGESKEGAYRVGRPGEGWRPLEDRRKRDIQVAWFSDELGAIIHVRVQCQEHGDSDLESFTDHLRIDFRDWQILEEPSGELDAHGQPIARRMQSYTRLVNRDALRTRVRAELDGQPVALELVVAKKDGCLIDLQLIAPESRFEAALPAFDRVVAGFRYPLDRS